MRALLLLGLTGCYAELAVGVREPVWADDTLERETTVKLLVGTSLGAERPGAGRVDLAVMSEPVPEEPGVAEEANTAFGVALGGEQTMVRLADWTYLRWNQRLEAEGVLVFDDSDAPGWGGHVLGFASGLGIALDNDGSVFDKNPRLRQVRDGQLGLFVDANLGHLAIGEDSGPFVGGEVRLKIQPFGLVDWMLR
jgi:hypothetical protein